MRSTTERKSRFWRITTAGVFFQGGAAVVDTSTIVAALVHGLTGSTFAVGVAAAIVAGAVIAEAISYTGVFAASGTAAILQLLAVHRLRGIKSGKDR